MDMNVAVQQIHRLQKTEGTSYWHEIQWFDKLSDYSNEYDCGNTTNVCGQFRSWVNQTPDRTHVIKWRDFICTLDAGNQGIIPADLKVALLGHLNAILDHRSPLLDEFRRMFSRTQDWKVMRDISAASCFLNSFSQACNYGH
jgi:hypothetical protein